MVKSKNKTQNESRKGFLWEDHCSLPSSPSVKADCGYKQWQQLPSPFAMLIPSEALPISGHLLTFLLSGSPVWPLQAFRMSQEVWSQVCWACLHLLGRPLCNAGLGPRLHPCVASWQFRVSSGRRDGLFFSTGICPGPHHRSCRAVNINSKEHNVVFFFF